MALKMQEICVQSTGKVPYVQLKSIGKFRNFYLISTVETQNLNSLVYGWTFKNYVFVCSIKKIILPKQSQVRSFEYVICLSFSCSIIITESSSTWIQHMAC